MALNPLHRVYDFSGVFDPTNEHYFADAIHLNEAGNRIIAEQLAAKIEFGTK